MRLLCLAVSAAVFATATLAAADGQSQTSTLSVIDGLIEKCLAKDDLEFCLQDEAASALGRALNVESIPLAMGLSLTKSPSEEENVDENAQESARSMEPLSPYEKIWANLDKLVTSRSLTLKLSDLTEGRGKKKKLYGYLGVAVATAALILIPIKLKFIGLMAATALMIGKIALVIASLVGLKKLVSKPSEETTHVHYDSHRSDPASHYLAYSGQQPNTVD